MLVVTDAIVLHAFDYLETSRILRLLTREAGVQSVLAKGARRSHGRVGSAVDLFAEGEVQMYIKPTRELQTLASFDVTASRAALALDMDRFLAASAPETRAHQRLLREFLTAHLPDDRPLRAFAAWESGLGV